MLYKSTLEARDGTLIPVFCDGKTMFSRYAPAREVESFGAGPSPGDGQQEGGDNDFLMVCGLGNGLHIQSLARRFPASPILVIERSREDIRWLTEHFDMEDLLSRRNLWIATVSEAAAALVRHYNPLLHGNFRLLPLRSWMDQLPDEAESIRAAIQEALDSIAGDYSTQAHFGKIWLRNFFLNLAIAPELGAAPPLPDPSGYREAFVAAAGPGLEGFFGGLQDPCIRDKVYLIATDTALPALLRHSIRPDMAVTIDGQASSTRHFLQAIPRSMVLAADISSCPGVIRRCHSSGCPVLLFKNNNPLPGLLNQYLDERGLQGLPEIETGAGTVTAAAIDLARAMGFTQVQVGGGDFAYLDGKPYCRGTYFEDQFCREGSLLLPQEHRYVGLLYRLKTTGTGGRLVTPVLEGYRKSLSQYMQRHPRIRFVMGGGSLDLSSPPPPASSPRLSACRLGEGDLRGFVDWYKELLQAGHQDVISSILPFYGWYLKKNGEKCDVFHIMKLAYSHVVRYTGRYGK